MQLIFWQVGQDQAVSFFLFHCFTYLCASWWKGCLSFLSNKGDESILWGLIVLDPPCSWLIQNNIVLDKSFDIDLVLELWISQFLCFIVWWGHRELWIRFCRLDAIGPSLWSLMSIWGYLVLFLRKILKNFCKDLLINWHSEFLISSVRDFCRHNISTTGSRRLSWNSLVTFSWIWVMEPNRTFVFIYQCDLLIESGFVLPITIREKEVNIFFSVVRWLTEIWRVDHALLGDVLLSTTALICFREPGLRFGVTIPFYMKMFWPFNCLSHIKGARLLSGELLCPRCDKIMSRYFLILN